MGSTQSSRPNTKTNNFYQLIQDIKKGTPDIIKIIKEFPNWKELEICECNFYEESMELTASGELARELPALYRTH